MSESVKKFFVISIYLTLALSVLLVFWQVRNFNFISVYDDNNYVSENSHVLNGLTSEGIIWALTTCYIGYWQPLTWLSFMLDCQLFGPDPGWIHLVNVFLHLANTLLLFTVFKKMTGSLWPSAFVAAAFALHPMHVESVAWIAERKDVLSTFFLLLTLAAYVGYARNRGMFRYLLTVLLFVFGLLAKPMLVTLPFLLLLLDYWPLDRFAAERKTSLSRILIEKIPFFVLAAISSVITLLTQQKGGGIVDIKTIPLKDRVGNVFLSYAAYIGKMFWPQDLAVIYPFDAAGSITLWQFVLYALLLVGVSILVLGFWRSRKYLLVGWFWFVGTLIPVIGLVQFTRSSYADRFSYIPYIGLFIMAAWGLPELLSKWRYRKFALGISMVIVLTALGIGAHRQARYWKDSSALFSHAIAVTRDNYVAYGRLAQDFYLQGNIAHTIELCKKSLEINPDYPDALLGLGCALADRGNTTEAIECYQKTLRLQPDCADAYNYLGVALQKQGKVVEAVAQFARAVELAPESSASRYNFAGALRLQGRFDEALEQLRAAVRLKPNWPFPMNDIAWLTATHPELKNRDVNEAIRLASRVCVLTNYKYAAPLDTLAAAYAAAGRFSEAVDTAQKALSLAEDTNQPQIKNAIQYQLSLYSQGKPFIESALKLPNDTNNP